MVDSAGSTAPRQKSVRHKRLIIIGIIIVLILFFSIWSCRRRVFPTRDASLDQILGSLSGSSVQIQTTTSSQRGYDIQLNYNGRNQNFATGAYKFVIDDSTMMELLARMSGSMVSGNIGSGNENSTQLSLISGALTVQEKALAYLLSQVAAQRVANVVVVSLPPVQTPPVSIPSSPSASSALPVQVLSVPSVATKKISPSVTEYVSSYVNKPSRATVVVKNQRGSWKVGSQEPNQLGVIRVYVKSLR